MDETFAAFLPFLLMTIPFVILNIIICPRKGKNPVLFGLLSIIPLIGVYLAIYLVSITDKSVIDKIDLIITKLENK